MLQQISAIMLNSHPVHGTIHTRDGVLKPFPVLAVDGVPLNEWLSLSSFCKQADVEPSGVHVSVPAQGWLYDQIAQQNAWALLKPTDWDGSTVVPVLVCPDDMDLSCNVIVVEQSVEQNKVIWRRFGYAVRHMHGIVVSVQWRNPSPYAVFDKTSFIAAYQQLLAFEEAWA